MAVEASWLTARVAADDAARAPTERTLLARLAQYLDAVAPDEEVELIDLGAGSGANQRWIAPRLEHRQRWVHLDHDAAILTHTDAAGSTRWPTEFVVGGVDALPRLLSREPSTVRVITCAAVLDVLTRGQLDALCLAVLGHAAPALFSLSVTGELRIEPPDPYDEVLLAAFNAHQRRGGRPGPDAADVLADRLRAGGAEVETEETPWVLTPRDDQHFVDRFLTERVDAAVEQQPSLYGAARAWLGRRRSEAANPGRRIVVGHRDVLALPA